MWQKGEERSALLQRIRQDFRGQELLTVCHGGWGLTGGGAEAGAGVEGKVTACTRVVASQQRQAPWQAWSEECLFPLGEPSPPRRCGAAVRHDACGRCAVMPLPHQNEGRRGAAPRGGRRPMLGKAWGEGSLFTTHCPFHEHGLW